MWAAVNTDLTFHRWWFKVHLRPLSAWKKSISKEPQHEKSKLGKNNCVHLFYYFCIIPPATLNWAEIIKSIMRFNPSEELSVVLCCAQIEVIHDYQESRSCVLYSLEGEDSPDLLKRSVRPQHCSWWCLICDSLCCLLTAPSGSVPVFSCVFVCVTATWWGNS